MTTYRVGIVGCGGIARSHMDGYLRVDNAEVVAAADPIEGAREGFCEDFGIPSAYATYEEMLEKEDLDIVSVCTWHLLHPAPTIAAAEAGVKGVICEKPMAIGMGDANRMVEACEKSGTKLVISHQRRFTPGWEKARKLMQEGAIGDPVLLTGRVREGLANWATHTIDGMLFVMDDPEVDWVMGAVERVTDRYERDTAIEDCCLGVANLKNGAQILIQSDLHLEGESAGHFQIRGRDGMMEITERSVRLFSGDTNGWEDVALDMEEENRAIGGETNAAQTRELIAWLEGGTEHRGEGKKARATVEVMMALYESARQNRVIHLPLQEKAYPLDLMIEEGKVTVEKPGRYDIRGFLKRDAVDEAAYNRLKAEGLGHHAIMRRLYEEGSR